MIKNVFRRTESERDERNCNINASSNGNPMNDSDMAEGRDRSRLKKSHPNPPGNGSQGASTASTSSTLCNRPSLPPLAGQPSPGFRERPGVIVSDSNGRGARWMTDREEAQYWYERYRLQKTETKNLNGVVKRLEEDVSEQSRRAEDGAIRYIRENEKLERLRASHVRAVNDAGSGLEPIADQSFTDRFRTLHQEVGMWCRNGFQKGEYTPQSEIDAWFTEQRLIRKRVLEPQTLRFSELIECVAWAFLEESIFSLWMPGLDGDILTLIPKLDASIEQGVNASSASSEEKREKISIWRAQTASLLFQDPQCKLLLADVSTISSGLLTAICSVPQLPILQENLLPCIHRSLRTINILAAEMRCQRGSFRLDKSVRVGEPFDETKMYDVRCTEIEEGTQAVIAAVLSRGWIRTPPREAGGHDRLICKTRVLVRVLAKR